MNPSEQHVLGKSAAAELSDRWVKWLSMVNCIIARWPEWEPNWSPLQETSMRPQAFNIFYLHLNFNICCCNPSFSIHLHTCPRSSPLQFGHVSEPKCPYKKWPDQHASIVCLVPLLGCEHQHQKVSATAFEQYLYHFGWVHHESYITLFHIII